MSSSPTVAARSGKPVLIRRDRLVRDKQGQEYLAGSVPASESTMVLPAGQRTGLQEDTALKFSRAGRAIEIDGMTAYVSQVEFADGHVWVPSRQVLDSSRCCGLRRRRRRSSVWPISTLRTVCRRWLRN
jgi:hypothetical protein